MELNKAMLTSVIILLSMARVSCSTKFQISKFNMCPPEDSKFLSLMNLSLEQCVDECYRRKLCYAVGFKRFYNLCGLYSTYTATEASLGKCVIVNKDDIQSHSLTINEANVCDKFEVSQSNGMDVTCSRKECQVEDTIENAGRLGNLNEIGAKKVEYCTQSEIDGKQIQTLECSSDGKWKITDGKWKTGSTLDKKWFLAVCKYWIGAEF